MDKNDVRSSIHLGTPFAIGLTAILRSKTQAAVCVTPLHFARACSAPPLLGPAPARLRPCSAPPLLGPAPAGGGGDPPRRRRQIAVRPPSTATTAPVT